MHLEEKLIGFAILVGMHAFGKSINNTTTRAEPEIKRQNIMIYNNLGDGNWIR